MAGETKTNGAFEPVVQPFVEFWSAYARQANDATRELLEGMEEQTNLKTVQRKWFDTVSQSADAYMRTPVYLQALKQNTDSAVKMKQQFDDVVKEIARNANIPTASDISGLFERLHSVEEVIISRLNKIDERLELIEEKFANAEFAKSET